MDWLVEVILQVKIMKVLFWTTKFSIPENVLLIMVFMKGCGKTIKGKDRGNSLGLLVVSIKVCGKTIKGKDRGKSLGLMVKSIKVCGKTIKGKDRGN